MGVKTAFIIDESLHDGQWSRLQGVGVGSIIAAVIVLADSVDVLVMA